MTTKQINTAITKITGIERDYANNLNAMHEAEMTLPPEPMVRYCAYLFEIVGRDFGKYRWEQFHEAYRTARIVFATAAQRAQAFLMTLGLWEAK